MLSSLTCVSYDGFIIEYGASNDSPVETYVLLGIGVDKSIDAEGVGSPSRSRTAGTLHPLSNVRCCKAFVFGSLHGTC